MENKTVNQALERSKNDDGLQNGMDHMTKADKELEKCMKHQAPWREDEGQNQENVTQ